MVRGRKNVISYFSRKRHGLGHAVSHFITSFRNKVHKVEENADVLPLFLSGISMSISACGQDQPNTPAFKRVLHMEAAFSALPLLQKKTSLRIPDEHARRRLESFVERRKTFPLILPLQR